MAYLTRYKNIGQFKPSTQGSSSGGNYKGSGRKPIKNFHRSPVFTEQIIMLQKANNLPLTGKAGFSMDMCKCNTAVIFNLFNVQHSELGKKMIKNDN